jgi:ribosomal protein L28
MGVCVVERSAGRHRTTLVATKFTVPASGRVQLHIKLPTKALKSVRRAGKLHAVITVTLKNDAGRTSVARKSVVLKAPRA